VAFSAQLSPIAPDPGRLPALGLGCAPIGNLYNAVTEDDAEATVQAALDGGIRFFDTAPHYGAGVSERRLGLALRGTARDTFTVATKVGRRIVDAEGREVAAGEVGVGVEFDLSRSGVMRSLESSLLRMGLDRIDVVYLHDPQDVDEALDGAFDAMVQLREEGVVRAIGVGMNVTAPLVRFVNEAAPDVVMIAGRYTLLDRSAAFDLLPAAQANGVEVIAAGVFNSGILADPMLNDTYDYRPAPEAVMHRARELWRECTQRGTPLPGAAIQFPLRHDAVGGVVVGARTAAEVDEMVVNATAPTSDRLWERLHA
jgi:D-threo-aldose 1-dehydrogenase